MAIKKTSFLLILSLVLAGFIQKAQAQKHKKAIISYYSGNPDKLDSFNAKQMTHIIYCFGHLKGDQYHISRMRDTLAIQKMVAMKKVNPQLKVLLSLGGWGGCRDCSDVFSSPEGRYAFVKSFKEVNDYFGTDGIDLDWEYPAVLGFPGHPFKPEDRDNFTSLIKELRKQLGKKHQITFAAGGFQSYIDSAVDWNKVTPIVNYINLMTYDLVGGYSKVTGHHTPLYSSAQQKESTNNCVQRLLKKGVDPRKLIIGAAFYARVWENVSAENNGLFNPGKFKMGINYKDFPTRMSPDSGFVYHWDEKSKAPYAYHPEKKLFATFDNKKSIALKSKYVLDHKLGGIMYWELSLDTYKDGLVQTINDVFNGAK